MCTKYTEVGGVFGFLVLMGKGNKTLSSLKAQMQDPISTYNNYSFILKMLIKHLPHAKDLAVNNIDLASFSHAAYTPVEETHC